MNQAGGNHDGQVSLCGITGVVDTSKVEQDAKTFHTFIGLLEEDKERYSTILSKLRQTYAGADPGAGNTGHIPPPPPSPAVTFLH